MRNARVFISGLTGAGKTTHSRILASCYSLSYVSASSLLLNRLGVPAEEQDDIWMSAQHSLIESRRLRDRSLDRVVDSELVRRAGITSNAVFDSWGLPWLCSGPGLRIWLESSLESRVMKVIVSHEGRYDYETARSVAQEKDKFTRNYFLSEYGFDLFIDRSIFDAVLDISDFIEQPTSEASARSIAHAEEIIEAVVEWHNQSEPGDGGDSIKDRYGLTVVKKLCRL